MRRSESPMGRAGLGTATLLAATCLFACAIEQRPPIAATPMPSPFQVTTAAPPAKTPAPSSPTAFAFEQIQRTFPAIASLTSTGEQLYWASEGSIWRFSPGETEPERVYASPDEGALIWDIAATDGAFAFSEELATPAGFWRVVCVADVGAAPVEVDRGIAERGRPPTLAIDDRRIAWAGFDESAGTPKSFLRIADRTQPAAPSSLLDVDIEDRLLWYPALDGDALWYSTIDPDFEGTGAGDVFAIETVDLSEPSFPAVEFEGSGLDFEPAVSPDYIVWKSVQPGFSALTWGEIHVLDRRSDDRLVIPGQADHPTLGSRFVAFEEFFHEKVLLYDLATRSVLEVPDPPHGSKGTVGGSAVGGSLFAYSISARGAVSVYWTFLPD